MTPFGPAVRATALGGVAVLVDDEPIELTPSERQCLAGLVAVGPLGLSPDQLAEDLWGELLPTTWNSSLRNRISAINRKTPVPIIEAGRGQRRLTLPAEMVDSWMLLQMIDDPGSCDPIYLLGTPFAGVEVSPLIRAAIDEVESVRRDVLVHWERTGKVLSNHTLSGIRALVANHPFDLQASRVAALLHLTSGDQAGARQILDLVRAEHEYIGGSGSTEVLVDIESLLDGDDASDEVDLFKQVLRPPVHSPRLMALSRPKLIGRTDLVTSIMAELERPEVRGAVLEGDQGAGKTRLVAELSTEMFKAGYDTTYLAASGPSISSLQPFVETYRELAPVFDGFLASRLHDPSDRARCWIAVLNFLEQRHGDRPLCMVVDDGQWLDRLSQSLILFLSRTGLDQGLKLLVVGRSIQASTAWPSLVAELTRAEFTVHHVPTLDESHIKRLINDTLDISNSVLLAKLVTQIHQQSHGLPAIARWLVDRIDRQTFVVPSGHFGLTGYSAIVASLDEGARIAGTAASVLGSEFALGDLVELLNTSSDETLSSVEKIVDVGLLEESLRPDEWRFAHVLAAGAFEETLSAGRRSRLHERALGITSNVHLRAWHASRSVSRTGTLVAARALVASGRAHFETGNYLEAGRVLQEVEEIDESMMTLDLSVMLAEALERSGQDASSRRSTAVAAALVTDRPAVALDAATCGLPETERLSGDPDRIALIRSIDPDRLAIEDQIRHAVHLSRQLLLVGQLAEAREVATAAFARASSPREKAETWLAMRHADSWAPSTEDAHPTEWIGEINSERLTARVREAGAITAVARGLTDEARTEIQRHLARARVSKDPLAMWHAMLIEATARTDSGDIDGAMALASEAEDHGLRLGLSTTAGGAAAQAFSWYWLQGQHGSLLESLSVLVDDVRDNVLYRAGLVAAQEASGQLSDAMEGAYRVAEEAARSRFEIGVLGLIAPVIALTGDRDLIERTSERLDSSRGSNIIIGAAVADLGPCSRILSQLTADIKRRQELLAESAEQADQTVNVVWQIKCRLDLADTYLSTSSSKAKELTDEARERATTPWLRQLVDSQAGPP